MTKALPTVSQKTLWFTPYAWAKVAHWKQTADEASVEMGFYGISSVKDKMLIEDVWMPTQECTGGSATFEELGNDVEVYLKRGYGMERILHIWGHTHPDMSANPSSIDENQWEKPEHAAQPWSIMVILGAGGRCYGRLRVNTPLTSVEIELDVAIDWSQDFQGVTNVDRALWEKEFEDHHNEQSVIEVVGSGFQGSTIWNGGVQHIQTKAEKEKEGKQGLGKPEGAEGDSQAPQDEQDRLNGPWDDDCFEDLFTVEEMAEMEEADPEAYQEIVQDAWDRATEVDTLARKLGITKTEVAEYGLAMCRQQVEELGGLTIDDANQEVRDRDEYRSWIYRSWT